jgi:hypothetical protein
MLIGVGGRGSCGSLWTIYLLQIYGWFQKKSVPDWIQQPRSQFEKYLKFASPTCSKPLVHFVPTSTRRYAAPPSIYDHVSMHVGLSVGCHPNFDVSDWSWAKTVLQRHVCGLVPPLSDSANRNITDLLIYVTTASVCNDKWHGIDGRRNFPNSPGWFVSITIHERVAAVRVLSPFRVKENQRRR